MSKPEMTATMDALHDFGLRWWIDGEWIRCRGCSMQMDAGYHRDGRFRHGPGCPIAAAAEDQPWTTLVQILMPMAPRAPYVAPLVTAQPLDDSRVTVADTNHGYVTTVAGWRIDAGRMPLNTKRGDITPAMMNIAVAQWIITNELANAGREPQA